MVMIAVVSSFSLNCEACGAIGVGGKRSLRTGCGQGITYLLCSKLEHRSEGCLLGHLDPAEETITWRDSGRRQKDDKGEASGERRCAARRGEGRGEGCGAGGLGEREGGRSTRARGCGAHSVGQLRVGRQRDLELHLASRHGHVGRHYWVPNYYINCLPVGDWE